MAYIPSSGSVVAFQSDPTKLQASVTGRVDVGNLSAFPGSVVAFLGNSTNASVITVGTAAANQSISGTVEVGNFPTTQNISGSVFAVGSITALQGTQPWHVQLTSGSIATTVETGNSSVQLLGGNAMVGSIAAYQGATGPWRVELTSGSVITTGGNSSVQVVGVMPAQSVSGVGLFDINPTGGGSILAKLLNSSVTAYQGATPWVITGSVQGDLNATVTSASVVQQGIWRVSVLGVGGAGEVKVTGSIQGTMSVLGTVPVTQSTNPWIITGSIQGGGGGTQYVEDTAQTSVTATAILFRQNDTTSIMGVISPSSPLPVQGSVTALQGTNPWVVGNSSVQVVGQMPAQSVSGVGLFNINPTGGGSIIAKLTNSSVTAYQGVSPWNIAGSVAAFLAGSTNASVITVGTAAANQSISGTVEVGNFPTTQNISGSVFAVGSVTALQGTNPWVVQLTSGSVITTGGNSSVQVVGTVPTTSVIVVPGIGVLGSVAALQGTQPWLTQIVSSVATRPTPASVQLMAGTNVIGSIATLQGTQPWLTQIVTSVATRATPASVSGVGIFNVNHAGNGSVLVVVPGSVMTTFNATSLISGHASTVNASSGSVLVLASVQATLYAYVTDFLLSNTGAATTLVTFTDRDGSVMGKSIAPTGGGAVATAITSPMRTLVAGSPVFIGASTATSTLHAWVGGYKGL